MRGWDVVELYEAGRWGFTLNLIDHLPRASHYVDAVLQDDDLAESAPDLPEHQRPEVPLVGYTPEVEALDAVIDRLGELLQAVVAGNGGKPPQVRPRPRPVTALDRRRAQRRREADKALERRLFPHLHDEEA